MQALNAAALTPSSILSANKPKPTKFQSLPTISHLRISKPFSQNSTSSSKTPKSGTHFLGGLVLLSSIFNAKLASALTYEEVLQLQQSVGTGSSASDGFDFGVVIDSAISFGTENPLIVFGGVAVVAVPLIVSQFFKGGNKAWGVESARNAYAKLGELDEAQLLDIRPLKELKEKGSPDVSGLRKKVVSVVYNGEDKPGFLKKLGLKFKEPDNTTLFIIDKFDGNSELVAELVYVNGFKAAYAIKDGADGPRGWLSSGLPWTAPKKSLSLNLGSLSESLSGVFDDPSDVVSLTLTFAAATGLSLLAFTEIETILQLLGSAALVQFVSTKLLLAEDRKKTLKEVADLVDSKIAPKELLGELTVKYFCKYDNNTSCEQLQPNKQNRILGRLFFLRPVISKALPAATTAILEATPDTTSETSPEPKAEAEAEAAPAPAAQVTPPLEVVNSVPKPEVKTESVPEFSRPLSPYASYPDYKPPTSPTPSPP